MKIVDAGIAFACLSFAACGEEEPCGLSLGVACEAGRVCTSDGDCQSRHCVDSVCAATCSGLGADCGPGFVCGSGSVRGDFYCGPPCTESTLGVVCVAGVPTHCDLIDGIADCRSCPFDCGEASKAMGVPTYCDAADGVCKPQVGPGEACSNATECTTNSCDVPESGGGTRCLVQAGQPCTADNCGLCTVANGAPTCFRRCMRSADCLDPVYACVRHSDGAGACREYCAFRSCPPELPCREVTQSMFVGDDPPLDSPFCIPP